MATVVRKEVRKRGFFGWVFLLIFLAFNAFMALWVWAAFDAAGSMDAASDAERAGHAVGTGIAVFTIMIVWAVGAFITGLLALLTRGGKTVVTEEVRG